MSQRAFEHDGGGTMQQHIYRPLTSDQEEVLAVLFEEINEKIKPALGDAELPSAAEGVLLTSFFLKIASSSERSIILRLAEALADRAEPS